MLFCQVVPYKVDFGATVIQYLELPYLTGREYYF